MVAIVASAAAPWRGRPSRGPSGSYAGASPWSISPPSPGVGTRGPSPRAAGALAPTTMPAGWLGGATADFAQAPGPTTRRLRVPPPGSRGDQQPQAMRAGADRLARHPGVGSGDQGPPLGTAARRHQAAARAAAAKSPMPTASSGRGGQQARRAQGVTADRGRPGADQAGQGRGPRPPLPVQPAGRPLGGRTGRVLSDRAACIDPHSPPDFSPAGSMPTSLQNRLGRPWADNPVTEAGQQRQRRSAGVPGIARRRGPPKARWGRPSRRRCRATPRPRAAPSMPRVCARALACSMPPARSSWS